LAWSRSEKENFSPVFSSTASRRTSSGGAEETGLSPAMRSAIFVQCARQAASSAALGARANASVKQRVTAAASVAVSLMARAASARARAWLAAPLKRLKTCGVTVEASRRSQEKSGVG